jgi:hypothetical protein
MNNILSSQKQKNFIGGITMTKKLFIIVSLLFSLLFISTVSLANNNMDMNTNPVNNIRNTAAGAIEGTRNGIQNAAGAVTNMTNNLRGNDDMNNGTRNTTNSTLNNNGGATNGATTNRAATNYRTTRTSADINNVRKTSNTITWVTLAIAAVVITGLVWYYATTDAKRDQ